MVTRSCTTRIDEDDKDAISTPRHGKQNDGNETLCIYRDNLKIKYLLVVSNDFVSCTNGKLIPLNTMFVINRRRDFCIASIISSYFSF